MDAKKFYKYDKIYKYTRTGEGRFTSYKDAIDADTLAVLKYAATKGYIRSANDAPHGGKHGEHFEVLRYFTLDSMAAKMFAEARRLNKALAGVLKTEPVDRFWTYSDIGGIVIDGVLYKNYYGDGDNTIEICAADEAEFKAAEVITRRQIYNTSAPLTIVKFDAPRAIVVEITDCPTPDSDKRRIENVLGFAIWERKAKIFVKKAEK